MFCRVAAEGWRIKGRVRYLKGEGALRHSTLRDWREEAE
jgi:hypothetical protein